jgi:ferrous iron transport protein B
MYCVGAIVAIPVAWALKKLFFPGETPHFVMELPSYKLPSPRVVFDRVYDRGKAFVVRAGTLIFATTIVIWALGYFPGDHAQQHQLQRTVESMEDVRAAQAKDVQEAQLIARVFEQLQKGEEISEADERAFRRTMGVPEDEPLKPDVPAVTESAKQYLAQQQAEFDRVKEQLDQLQHEYNEVSAGLIANSALGRMGHAIEPAVKPLGWDWRIGVGAIASFPAREVIIATLGTIYSLGGDVDEESEGLKGAMKASTWPDGTKVFNVPVALSIMVFFALCAQCAATLMVIKRETNSWRWPIFSFVYMTILAYIGALITYQVGSLWL